MAFDLQNSAITRFYSAAVLAMMLCIISGCGGSSSAKRPKTVKVTGTVTYKSQPVSGAQVTFLGDGKTVPAVAITDTNGKFRCTTFEPNDGAIPGEHTVIVSKSVSSGGDSEDEAKPMQPGPKAMENAMLRGQKKAAAPTTMYLVPKKYSSASSSPLQYTVKDGEANDFQIDLTD